ncbi:hypothetical protein KP509_16G082400 [Ceratopteris richardii]|uniref:Uncharacterized protein n=1 Tax=Ceratopteris richardii TaxID=49495 RepID=A0A8T2T442_CERRI|nr:hypothetical protein KP509_16G082400 [Ceratopteris richardii]
MRVSFYGGPFARSCATIKHFCAAFCKKFLLDDGAWVIHVRAAYRLLVIGHFFNSNLWALYSRNFRPIRITHDLALNFKFQPGEHLDHVHFFKLHASPSVWVMTTLRRQLNYIPLT